MLSLLEVETKPDTEVTNNAHNGEADQNSNVVQKIDDEVQEKEKELRLQVCFHFISL